METVFTSQTSLSVMAAWCLGWIPFSVCTPSHRPQVKAGTERINRERWIELKGGLCQLNLTLKGQFTLKAFLAVAMSANPPHSRIKGQIDNIFI